MTTPEIVVIERFANELDAERVRNVLGDFGITAFVEGANVNTMLSYVGPALGGVRLLVRAGDVPRAKEIIDKLQTEQPSEDAAWYCGVCHEQLDASFELCWKCGGVRADVERPQPGTNEDSLTDSTQTPRTTHDHLSQRAGDRNQIASVSQADANSAEAEELCLRAWRSALFGLVMLPVVLHIYSLYLLLSAARLTSKFSEQGQRRFNGALVIDLLVAALVGIVIRFAR